MTSTRRCQDRSPWRRLWQSSVISKRCTRCGTSWWRSWTAVWTWPPPVYHLTALARDNYRRQACLLAVASARRKAHEVCRLLGLSLGRPLSVHELPAVDDASADDDGDWLLPVACSARREHGLASSSAAAADQNAAATSSSSLRDHVEAATESVRSGVVAVFELRPPKRAGAEGRHRRR
ncbi:interleukin-1 receptor-associated kinase 1-binding protein 1 [Lampetra planeri]